MFQLREHHIYTHPLKGATLTFQKICYIIYSNSVMFHKHCPFALVAAEAFLFFYASSILPRKRAFFQPLGVVCVCPTGNQKRTTQDNSYRIELPLHYRHYQWTSWWEVILWDEITSCGVLLDKPSPRKSCILWSFLNASVEDGFELLAETNTTHWIIFSILMNKKLSYRVFFILFLMARSTFFVFLRHL